ncbi:MAG: dihydropteroate synthase, partial [Bacteroidota bacterium]
STPALMGILNLTPDSFHDGGQFNSIESAIARTGKMLEDGATIIDVGAQSTRPGAEFLNAEQEWDRLCELLPELVRTFPETVFSIDTFHSQVAIKAINAGCSIVNDVSGGELDPNMFSSVAALKAPYILMHMQGTPATMQEAPEYEDVTRTVFDYFLKKSILLREAGVKDILLDPGFGFGKTLEQNFELLHALPYLKELEYPILVGLSRKSMVNKVIGTLPESALNGTTVLNTIALENGASVLRVHDVKEATQAVKLVHFYQHVREKSM